VPDTRQKGVITLTTGRSGSSWLGGLVNSAGTMGHSGEWLDMNILPKPRKSYSADGFFAHVISAASSANGHFSMKIFPHHVQDTTAAFKVDILRRAITTHDIKLLLLTREDRLGQAISLVRARQTGKWGSTAAQTSAQPQRYSFKRLCKAYFHIGKGYDFWRSYLAINDLTFEAFTYETLLENPAPFLESHARHFGVALPEAPHSGLKIQRDDTTNTWRQRFLQDIAERGVHSGIYELEPPEAGLGNAVKVAFGHPLYPRHGGAKI